MGSNDTPRTPKQIFTDISVQLTGFDRAELAGTGMIDTYYDTLLRMIGEREAGQLLRYASEAIAKDQDKGARNDGAAFRAAVIENPRFGSVAVSLIKLWYLGRWYPLSGAYRDRFGSTADDVEHVVSSQGYREGLVWVAAGAHPMGGKPPGFGSWAQPPSLLDPQSL
ncbi:hypothetical protein A6P39_006825 [Streptomyces sp. FXJ1.172]|uniref:hypothetical protein n=1 Tax=Streptomyces sp. FXJ1.172 TaxID=710705 RepID=UPI0007CF3880|nr:hypothetical protein [Streptomyces sp. FXJ1.172]WEO93745.1 hypothetical protein A6P39_006825 [Streptomyces sp. FXJ1.172]